ncbi:nickel-dependent lactate racemase [Phycisphaera mikurensis]|uniref:Uncharacterized protein n=1 Tax=Phycisphaera mikurensis (strain NBRC 102666 / KCTC 22515 / FYK2301M01) TaxID=1142394 RepID=I0IC56_PHYMF|nr:nickel-dependent lactate racemase [Phycisphaera mikurensis]MBB6441936.1 nickel-dependent lactate racemase [Phycisphaera mikurensis]BAM02844.1 hypothetical protein PSMK_06850 [Phycisphaera mikurensis NBRC 102666]
MAHVSLRYGRSHASLRLPDDARVLSGPEIPALPDPAAAVRAALREPIGCASLRSRVSEAKPRTVAISISDITRPVPNELLIEAVLGELAAAEPPVPESAVVVIVATGMHRESTPEERRTMLGDTLPARLEVIDHTAHVAGSVRRVSEDPPVSVCERFLDADFRIVTGLIEPHFMAGFSGGRKGVCPGLVDLDTVQRFHGVGTMGDPNSVEGRLDGNPCHEIATEVAGIVAPEFLLNVAITHGREVAGVYAGELTEAFRAGCADVAGWTSAAVDAPFGLVVTSAGGYPLDKNFYQTVKSMCTALPALGEGSTLLVLSACDEVGEPAYEALYERFGPEWRAFLEHIETSGVTDKDQWEYQMQTRVLSRIGIGGLVLANDGLDAATQRKIATTPCPGAGDAVARAQAFVDGWVEANPGGRVAVIPEGPYTMLAVREAAGV